MRGVVDAVVLLLLLVVLELDLVAVLLALGVGPIHAYASVVRLAGLAKVLACEGAVRVDGRVGVVHQAGRVVRLASVGGRGLVGPIVLALVKG